MLEKNFTHCLFTCLKKMPSLLDEMALQSFPWTGLFSYLRHFPVFHLLGTSILATAFLKASAHRHWEFQGIAPCTRLS